MRLPVAWSVVVAVLLIPTGAVSLASEAPGALAAPPEREVVPSRALPAPHVAPGDGLLVDGKGPTVRTPSIQPRQPAARHLLDDGCSRSPTFGLRLRSRL